MKIQILGSGCEKCKKLAANVEEATKKIGIPCEIEKVTDINQITEFGVMMTPALVVDGKVVNVGKVLSCDEVIKFLQPSENVAPDSAPAKPEENCCSCSSSAETPESTCCCPAEPSPCCGKGGNGKKIMTAILLIFVLASVAFVIIREVKSSGGNDTSSSVGIQTPVAENVLKVYYFHGTQRCFTCNKIEELTKEAINSKFAQELADGKMVFYSINVDEAANEHFIKDFQLATRCVVIQKNDQFERLDAVWQLVGQPEDFTKYIQDNTARMLETK